MIRARVLAFLAWSVVSLWSLTLRVRFVNSEARDRVLAEGGSCIYAFWHGSMFLLLGAARRSNIVIPVSESSDGEIMASVLRRFGFSTVRGSSSRNGYKALFAMVCRMRRGGTVAVAVDGPKGPVHEVKKGAAYLAAKMKVPVIPVACATRRTWVLRSTWEKMMLPMPFTSGLVLFGDPVRIGSAGAEEVEAGRRRLEQALRSLSREAERLAAEGNEREEADILSPIFSERQQH